MQLKCSLSERYRLFHVPLRYTTSRVWQPSHKYASRVLTSYSRQYSTEKQYTQSAQSIIRRSLPSTSHFGAIPTSAVRGRIRGPVTRVDTRGRDDSNA